MFNLPVARSMLEYLCQGFINSSELKEMTAAFVASKRERKSSVTPEQRDAGIFREMQAEVDKLPSVFVRRSSGVLEPL